jgi:hypothetical protein
MVAATQSYRERMKAQRAEARAKRDAEKAEWHRRAELRYEIRKLALDAVKAGIRARGDKVQLYSHAQLMAQANAMIGPWLVAQAKAIRRPHPMIGIKITCVRSRSAVAAPLGLRTSIS